MTQVTLSFLLELQKSRVLTPAAFKDLRQKLNDRGIHDPLECAKFAVAAKALTRFQAEEILNKRARRLRINDYILENILGIGGMGHVYLAHHHETGERVALKVLADRLKHDAGMRSRFILEGRSGMAFNFPRLVRTLELDKVEDLYGEVDYMVMEFFPGVTLLEGVLLSDGQIKIDAMADIACQAAEGLEYLHQQGMVHRDVKPENILVDCDGNTKLLDFGLTLAAMDEEFSLAMIFGHDCLGTADFVAPEQSLDSLNVDARADVYSLGCTLFLTLAARQPFPANNRAEIVKAHRTHPRPRVDEFNKECPKELADIIERMMAIDPAERPASMREVIDLLSPYRKQRKWSFDIDDVLAWRRKRREKISKSTAKPGQATRPTKVTSKGETEGGIRPAGGSDCIHEF